MSIRSKADIPTIRKLAAMAQHAPGDVVEFGVYQGGSAVELCRLFPTRTVHLFDSCEGLPHNRGPLDGDRPGAFAATREAVIDALDGYTNWQLHPGWFAETLRVTGGIDLICFAHVDCDYAQSYADCVPWILARLATGGIVQFDDYGGACCKGATKYLDNLLGHELITHAKNGAHWVKVADA